MKIHLPPVKCRLFLGPYEICFFCFNFWEFIFVLPLTVILLIKRVCFLKLMIKMYTKYKIGMILNVLR